MKYIKFISMMLVLSLICGFCVGCHQEAGDINIVSSITPGLNNGTSSIFSSDGEAEDIDTDLPITITQTGNETKHWAEGFETGSEFKYSMNIPDFTLDYEKYDDTSVYEDSRGYPWIIFYTTRAYVSNDKKLVFFIGEYYGNEAYPPYGDFPTKTEEGAAASVASYIAYPVEKKYSTLSGGQYNWFPMVRTDSYSYIQYMESSGNADKYVYFKTYSLFDIQTPIVFGFLDLTSDHSYEGYIDEVMPKILASVKIEKRYTDDWHLVLPY